MRASKVMPTPEPFKLAGVKTCLKKLWAFLQCLVFLIKGAPFTLNK